MNDLPDIHSMDFNLGEEVIAIIMFDPVKMRIVDFDGYLNKYKLGYLNGARGSFWVSPDELRRYPENHDSALRTGKANGH